MRKRSETKQLGMNYSTAFGRLRKLVLFDLVKKLGRDICFRCDLKIKNVSDCTIDHKVSWRGKDIKLFWDLKNIEFSHSKCNSSNKVVSESSKKALGKFSSDRKIVSPKNKAWCNGCKKHLSVRDFNKNLSRPNGF